MFTHDEIDRLLAARTISAQEPWAAGDRAAIDRHLRTLCSKLEREADVASRIEWNHYGSGYASYVDAWFYRPRPDFRHPWRTDENAYMGLVVLLSRLAPCFVLMEGDKVWGATSSGGYLPGFEMLDDFTEPAIIQLVPGVQQILESNSLTRLTKEQLAAELDNSYDVPTILSNPPFRIFDALFYWQD